MTKGITGWIKTHTPIGRSKSEAPVERRASQKMEEAKRKISFRPEPIIKRSVSTAEPRPSTQAKQSKPGRTPPMPTELPPAPPIARPRIPPKPSEPPPLRPDLAIHVSTIEHELDQLLQQLNVMGDKELLESFSERNLDAAAEARAIDGLIEGLNTMNDEAIHASLSPEKIEAEIELTTTKLKANSSHSNLTSELDRLSPDEEKELVHAETKDATDQLRSSTKFDSSKSTDQVSQDSRPSRAGRSKPLPPTPVGMKGARRSKPLPEPRGMSSRLKPSESGQ